MGTRRDFLRHAAFSGTALIAGENQSRADVPVQRSSLKICKVPQTDIVVSSIAYGCADLSSWDAVPLSDASIDRAETIIHSAFENGITLFDHSDVYTFGKSEEAFGRVLQRSRGLRHQIVLQSKTGWVFPIPFNGDQYEFDCSYQHIMGAVDGSLRRLATDYLDILLLHWSDALVDPDEIAKAFDELKRTGKVRAFGVSNHTPYQIELLKRSVSEPLVINQVFLGLGHPNLILEGFTNTYFHNQSEGILGTLDYCRLHNMQIQAYAPLRGGLLNPSADARREVQEAADVLTDLAHKKNTNPASLALAWLLRHPAGIVPIIGSTNPDHIIDSCYAQRVTLTRSEWYSLLRSVAKIGTLST